MHALASVEAFLFLRGVFDVALRLLGDGVEQVVLGLQIFDIYPVDFVGNFLCVVAIGFPTSLAEGSPVLRSNV